MVVSISLLLVERRNEEEYGLDIGTVMVCWNEWQFCGSSVMSKSVLQLQAVIIILLTGIILGSILRLRLINICGCYS